MSIIATVLQLHPDLLQATLAAAAISGSKTQLCPQGTGARWAKGGTTAEAQRKAGLCFGETLTI